MVLETAEAHHVDVGGDDLLALGLGQALLLEPEFDVLRHRQPGKERVGLEDHAAVGAGSAHLAAVEEHAAAGRPVEPGDDAQQRRLPAAGRAEDGDEIVCRHGQIRRLERLHRLATAPAWKDARNILDEELGGRGLARRAPLSARAKLGVALGQESHANRHGNRTRFTALNRKSDTRPMRPMTMMPKMIWPVASSAWLSMIMWPIPEEDPISSATMT